MASPTVENYLKAIFHLSNQLERVTLTKVADELSVSAPTANSMIKTLKQDGLVNHKKYGPIDLTPEGRKAAALIVRKHRLTEMFLVERMFFGWEEVHAIAEQIEHIQSPQFFERMDEMLGHPQFDPHGSPIPDKDGAMHHHAFRRLSDCEPGQKLRLSAVMEAGDDFLKHLNAREIKLNTVFELLHIDSFDGSLRVDYEGHNAEVLSKMVGDRLLVVVEET
ncbi:MAG: metal-dependent transcriptional regulator [Bacteroidota bacterium]